MGRRLILQGDYFSLVAIPEMRAVIFFFNFGNEAVITKGFHSAQVLKLHLMLLQVDSVFNMKRPYDLVAFMKQEERASMLDQLKQELLARKDEIDKTEDRDTGKFCDTVFQIRRGNRDNLWIFLKYPYIVPVTPSY